MNSEYPAHGPWLFTNRLISGEGEAHIPTSVSPTELYTQEPFRFSPLRSAKLLGKSSSAPRSSASACQPEAPHRAHRVSSSCWTANRSVNTDAPRARLRPAHRVAGYFDRSVSPHRSAMVTSNPTQQRAKLFVNRGSNLLVEMFKAIGRRDGPSAPEEMTPFIWQYLWRATAPLLNDQVVGPMRLIRTYRFGSIQGSPEYFEERRVVLHRAGYEPALFAKAKGRGEKLVEPYHHAPNVIPRIS